MRKPQAPPVQFRNGAVRRELDRRADPGLSAGQVAARDLTRYYRLAGAWRALGALPATGRWSARDVAETTVWRRVVPLCELIRETFGADDRGLAP